ncbi:MAG: winged helix-turn-helix transcriptional regulator [Candidatus Eremiobacteraeota bacterium]|nr:winged helix-turn-helix transcriptional regulator [Candidatus Eremiobacteraeota bacterium]
MNEESLHWDDLVLNLGRRRLSLGGEPLKLTQKELELLEYFLRRPGQVITRDELMHQIWQVPPATVNQILDRNINSLRAKLRGRGKNIIQTIRGEGYALGTGSVIS